MSYTDYCFTLRKEDEADLVRLGAIATYMVVGEEVGEQDGYEHFQGFLQLARRMTIKSLKNFSRTARFANRLGTVEEAMQYCMKDGIFFQQGQVVDRPGQGARTDLEAFYDDAKEGTDLVTMYQSHTAAMIRYRRAYDDIRSAHASGVRSPSCIHWLFGAPGTGKGSFVRQACRGAGQVPYTKDPLSQWWCGYSNQKIVQIDEITPAVPYNVLLLAGDETPLRVPVKNGHAMFLAETIYITSNLLPEQIYAKEAGDDGRWGALLRRAAFYRVRREVLGRSSLERVRFTPTGWEGAGEPLREFDVQPAENRSVLASLCMQ